LEVAALALVEEDVEGEGGLARARHPGDDREAVARDLDVEVLQVVLARLVDDHRAALAAVAVARGGFAEPGRRGGRRRAGGERLRVGDEGLPGEGARVRAQRRDRAGADDLAAALAALGA